MKNYELQKAEEFSKVENIKTKYTKFVDEENYFIYNLELPNGKIIKDVDPDLALYLHSLENRLKINLI